MRVLLIMAVWGCLAVNAVADTPGSAVAGCFERIERKVSPGDTVTIITTDSAVVRGLYRSVMPGGSTMYLRSLTGSGNTDRMTIPLGTIDKITYSKRGRIFSILGFGAGFIAGAFTGAALAPEPEGFLDFSGLGCAIVGAFFGGLIGAAGGAEIDKQFRFTITLVCN